MARNTLPMLLAVLLCCYLGSPHHAASAQEIVTGTLTVRFSFFRE